MKPGDEGKIEIDPRVPFQQARQAIKYLVDASVELVTNSDDSYRRMGIDSHGSISLTLNRIKQGKWRYFKVSDNAEGMDLGRLREALIYGRSASGFEKGQPVRGLWGRGLKETILAIGSGTIETVSNGKYAKVEVWWDNAQRTANWRLAEYNTTDEPNGTTITVIPSQECTINAPLAENFRDQVANHYSLRDIWDRREGELRVDGRPGRGLTALVLPIRFRQPEGEQVLLKRLNTPVGDAVIRVWESPIPLPYNRAEPFSLAGFVVKSENASLDNTLLGLEADELARHFWGEVVCDGLAEHIRRGDEGLLTTTRQGLDWRHKSLRDLQFTLREEVKPLIEDIRRRTSAGTSSSIPEQLKKSLTDLLNRLASDELDGDGSSESSSRAKIDGLAIRPSRGMAPPGKYKTFSVYFPTSLATEDPTIVTLEYESDGDVVIDANSMILDQHPGDPSLLYGMFKLTGKRKGDESYIIASTETDIIHDDVAQFVVGEPEHRPPTTRGIVREIEYDDASDPQQRVQFSDGVIRIFQHFPGVSQYLPHAVDTTEGKAVLAELVLEAFCRQVARARLDRGDIVYVPGAEIDAFNAEVNRLMKKSMLLVHNLTIDTST